MSFQAMAWAVKQECKTPTAKLVLILIANYADENNTAYPSKDHLSKLANCDERTIRRSLRSLIESGYISVQDRHDNSGRQTSNRYIVHSDNMSISATARPVNTTQYRARTKAPKEGDIFAGVGGAKLSPNTIRNTQNKYTSDFDEWWKCYPRKDGSKKKAFEAWQKACDEISIAELLAKCRMFADSRKGEDPKFTPHATTWLNQKRYETVTPPVVKTRNLNSLAG